jgi:hypothetical protein
MYLLLGCTQKRSLPRERFFYFPKEKASMPAPFSLPKTVLPELPGDLPCVVLYVDAAQKTVLDYRWSTVAEVLPTVVIVQENQKAAKAGAHGPK